MRVWRSGEESQKCKARAAWTYIWGRADNGTSAGSGAPAAGSANDSAVVDKRIWGLSKYYPLEEGGACVVYI